MTEIRVDSAAAEAMLERIEHNAAARRELGFAAGRAAEQGARLISGVPVDSGELAGSVRALGTWIVATAKNQAGAPYGRFVFGGTRHMPARPPTVPAGAIARILADEILREVFK